MTVFESLSVSVSVNVVSLSLSLVGGWVVGGVNARERVLQFSLKSQLGSQFLELELRKPLAEAVTVVLHQSW